MNTYLILRRNGWSAARELEIAAGCSSRVATQEMPEQVRWIRSYVVREPGGGFGTVCVYQATGLEALREHARRAALPADEILPVGQTVVLADDPIQIS